MLHKERSELAGKTVRIRQSATHPQVENFGGSMFRVEDWWDRLAGKSWGNCDGNPTCLVYAVRASQNDLDYSDEVLYGKVGFFGHLVHMDEIEILEEGDVS